MAETKSANELAQERTELAVERTVLAADRSLMAWIRTGLSMIGFGFTIYKVLNAMQAQLGDAVNRPHAPRRIGLILIALGVTSILLGLASYVRTMKGFGKKYDLSAWRFPIALAGMISLLGIGLFVIIFLKIDFL